MNIFINLTNKLLSIFFNSSNLENESNYYIWLLISKITLTEEIATYIVQNPMFINCLVCFTESIENEIIKPNLIIIDNILQYNNKNVTKLFLEKGLPKPTKNIIMMTRIENNNESDNLINLNKLK